MFISRSYLKGHLSILADVRIITTQAVRQGEVLRPLPFVQIEKQI